MKYVIILSLALTISSTAFAGPAPHAECSEKVDSRFLDSISHFWQALEDSIIQHCDNLVEYVESIFQSSDDSAQDNNTNPAISSNIPKFKYDVTLVGFVNFADGIGRHPILFKECLKDNVKINFLSTRDIPAEIEDAQLGLPRLNPANKKDIGAVSILTDILADKAVSIYKKVPDSPIKIAYTMFESTRIPHSWVEILNNKFDIAVVPDAFLVSIYRKCGVQIPIFVLPLPLKLDEFLKIKPRTAPHTPFAFGLSGGFWKRKNHMRVLEAFAAEFGNRPDVKLRLHGRFGEEKIINELAEKIAMYGLTNVELIVRPFSWEEYLEFFKSLDCYVFLSQGEGFSITPREALACGKPCIVTNNTGQMSICNSGTVRVVRSDILIPAIYDCHYGNHHNGTHHHSDYGCHHHTGYHEHPCNPIIHELEEEVAILESLENLGYHFDCTIRDAREAMRDVFLHYNHYLDKARQGREWVKRYLQENLKNKYINLVKPESIILGDENIIVDQFLMTSSQPLYDKYQYVLGKTCDTH